MDQASTRARSQVGAIAPEIAELLTRARTSAEGELGELASRLAELLFRESQRRRTPAEQRHRASLARLVGSRESQLLTLTLTDRALRSAHAERSIEAVREVLGRVASPRGLALPDRVAFGLLEGVGSWLPEVTFRAVQTRLHHEAAPFVLDATEAALAARLGARRAEGFQINLNYLGEEVTSEAEAERRLSLYLRLAERPDVDALSVKLSALTSRLDLLAFGPLTELLVARLAPVLEKTQAQGKLLYFDMEAYRDLGLTLEVVERLALTPGLLGARLGVALQAYLPDSGPASERLVELARLRVARGGAPLRLRLVKGANLATESLEAEQAGLPLPIFPNKNLVDAHYKQLLTRLLSPEHEGVLVLGCASHNLFELGYALVLAERRGLRSMLQLEMLEGMAGATARVLSEILGPVLLYTPCVLPESFPAALSYLVRRLDENTAPSNFLSNAVRMEAGDELFERERARFFAALRTAERPLPKSYRGAARARETSSHFVNASDSDFTEPAERARVAAALAEAAARTYRITPLLGLGHVAADPRETVELAGFDPSRPGHEPYRVELAGPAALESALASLDAAADWLASVPVSERAQWLERAADELERERAHLISLLVLDAGKRVREADLEVSEAIDFARYYARSYLEQSQRYRLTPRGPTVVTPPWNFPLAIPLGGCFAALMAGNPVLLKPAPETPLVAWAALSLCHRAGIPRDALQFAPCADEHASRLITDARVRTVILTGATSTARLFLRLRPDLHLLAETGGKNGLYVSALCDREQAVSHVVKSAFGHAGQKCSALSVLVLEDELYQDAEFRRLLREATESLVVGSAWDPESFVTPLIEAPRGPLGRLLAHAGDAEWLVRPHLSPHNPRLLSPGILWNVQRKSFAQQTEFFGPIVSVLCARDLQHGLEILNDTPYGLTAGFAGLSEFEQLQFLEGMDAGNLYVNRAITGAIVGRQPFGGRKQSQFGPGQKAGGPGYVLALSHASPRSSVIVPAPARPRLAAAPLPATLPADVPGTPVLGEVNFLRYRPRPLVLLACEDAEPADVELCWAAARGVGAALELVAAADPVAFQRLAGRETLRVRVVGTPSEAVLRLAGELGWTLLADPVRGDLELESHHYLEEQSVSIAYHRHGNTSVKPALGPVT